MLLPSQGVSIIPRTMNQNLIIELHYVSCYRSLSMSCWHRSGSQSATSCLPILMHSLYIHRTEWWQVTPMVITSSLDEPILNLGKKPPNTTSTLCFPWIPSHLWAHKLDQMLSFLDSLLYSSIGTWKSYRQN